MMLQVLYVDVRMRLVTDIAILWQSVVNNLNREDRAVSLVMRPECTESEVNDTLRNESLPFHLYILNAVRCPYVTTFVRNAGRDQLSRE